MTLLSPLFPGVPAPSVVIYVVKNASRPVSGEDSPVPDGKRFALLCGLYCNSGQAVMQEVSAGVAAQKLRRYRQRITNQMKAKLRHVSEAKYNYFTFDNHDYPETKMVVKIGDRLRTIDLHGLDELSVEEALPDELLLPDGTIDFPNFETHMLEVAEEYIEHLPNKF